MVTAENQSLAAITRAAPGNRTAAPRTPPAILRAVLRDLEATTGRLRISDDLVRLLSAKLLARHAELRTLRAAVLSGAVVLTRDAGALDQCPTQNLEVPRCAS